MTRIHHVHSLIIYTADELTKRLFSSEEWKEICRTYPVHLEELSTETREYLQTFHTFDIQGIHRAANAPIPVIGQYKHEKHWELHWIRNSVVQWLGLYSETPSPMAEKDNSESFWRNDVYGVINSLMRDVPYMRMVHGELTVKESAQRRNMQKTGDSGRTDLGYKCDGLFQVSGHPNANVGVVEAGKSFNNNVDKKYREDCVKMTRELHDMLRVRIANLRVYSRARELTVLGYVISEWPRLPNPKEQMKAKQVQSEDEQEEEKNEEVEEERYDEEDKEKEEEEEEEEETE
ncbi:hypothetical protein BC939DRAFT_504845 [Gamsiella multidivaricata]|uniref:uncharacterized protein n=1 Tax=Gamsiella multidivaricata TaxID=101098 RepID=UPI00222072C3|nr:uncharacterized protein BC939DRAFT_504845 [Gamsiella multidivaricata]KAI7820626.1 hypothetical protein BC939DRAFT_504845 [Gamsiella multidivaricata]